MQSELQSERTAQNTSHRIMPREGTERYCKKLQRFGSVLYPCLSARFHRQPQVVHQFAVFEPIDF